MSEFQGQRKQDGDRALRLLEEALEILDQLEIPAEIGGHVDLAICRLRDRLENSRSTAGSQG